MDVNIDMTKLLFYGFSAIILASALMVIFSRNSVRAVLFLVLAFVGSSGAWMLLQSEFLALTLILVYVGAVMVLFLFVVMMLNMNIAPLKEGFVRYLPVGLLVAVLIVGQLVLLFCRLDFASLGLSVVPQLPLNYSNIEALGLALYSDYLYPFEIAGMLLLVAIIAAISLTFRGARARRSQNIAVQVATQKSDRLRILTDVTPHSDIHRRG